MEEQHQQPEQPEQAAGGGSDDTSTPSDITCSSREAASSSSTAAGLDPPPHGVDQHPASNSRLPTSSRLAQQEQQPDPASDDHNVASSSFERLVSQTATEVALQVCSNSESSDPDDPMATNAAMVADALSDVYSVEEFEKHASEFANLTAKKRTAAAPKRPAPEEPALKLIGASGDGEAVSVSELNGQCQRLGIPIPTYTFEGTSYGGYAARLTLLDHELMAPGPYVGKKIAKEAVAKKGPELLESMTAKGTFSSSSPELKASEPGLQLVGTPGGEAVHVSELNEKCQALGIPLPLYTYEGTGLVGFTARLKLLGQELKGPGPYAAKKSAKEGAAKKGLELLESMIAQGTIGEKKKKQKNTAPTAPEADPSHPLNKDPLEHSVNWTGLLLEYQNSLGKKKPQYMEYGLGQAFCCELHVDGVSRTFGGKQIFFSSKKPARQSAAREAVRYLKAQGLWPEDAGNNAPIKKRKSVPSAASNDTTSGDVDSKKETDSATSSNTPLAAPQSSPSPPASSSASFAAQAADLARLLGFPAPEYRIMPPAHGEPVPNFINMACFFDVIGPVGAVRNVYGKKRAKEECARLVVEWLESARAERRVQDDANAGAGEVVIEMEMEE